MIFEERMNPLGIEPDRFTVATDEQGRLLGFGQLEPKDGCFELRSMVVDASHRRQGIGRKVLRRLLEEAAGQEVVMTTITSRIPFYAAEGFERLQLKDVPRFLLFEVVAGTAVARIAAGEELVVLRRRADR
ncbi:g4606 [Coccomyxa viridis]|uniref:G4606 protein n=1 Tax=Coccomyxa viridis TaxID=1274662 RepID=A0ABP1FXM7_9CHLO